MTRAELDGLITARRAKLQGAREGPKASPTASPAAAPVAHPTAPAPMPAPAPVITAADRERARIAANSAPRPLGGARDEPWRPYVGPDGVIAGGLGWGGVSWEDNRS
jgi:hypothetical protein